MKVETDAVLVVFWKLQRRYWGDVSRSTCQRRRQRKCNVQ